MYDALLADGRNQLRCDHRLMNATRAQDAERAARARNSLHGLGDAVRDIAAVIGRRLGLPAGAVPEENFGPFGPVFAMDQPSSSARTRDALGWHPTHLSLLEDLENIRPRTGRHADAGQHARRAVEVLAGRRTDLRPPERNAADMPAQLLARLKVMVSGNPEREPTCSDRSRPAATCSDQSRW
jgi:hypothetical protein